MSFKDYENYDALGLAALVAKHEVSPAELLEAAIERAEARNPKLNAITCKLYDKARELLKAPLPRGPFSGVPFLLKDASAYGSTPSSFGSRWLRDTWIPDYDTELIKRYKSAGFVIFGKTSMPEFGTSPVTEPVAFGPCRNPWSLEHTPGGSSGGAASAVAGGIVPLAHGSDGAGSIRIPASCCGLFGLKPSRGRNPTGPMAGKPWQGMVQEHGISFSVRDSAALLDATAGTDNISAFRLGAPATPFLTQMEAPLKRLKIGLCLQAPFKHTLHSECQKAVVKTAHLCTDLGHEIIETDLAFGNEDYATAIIIIMAAELSVFIHRMAKQLKRGPGMKQLELINEALWVIGRHYTARDYADAVLVMDQATRCMYGALENYDVILQPSVALPPVAIGAMALSRYRRTQLETMKWLPLGFIVKSVLKSMVKTTFQFAPFTPMANMAGLPAMSVPLYQSTAGLPIGSQFVGRFAEEGILFSLARQLEQASPWQKPTFG